MARSRPAADPARLRALPSVTSVLDDPRVAVLPHPVAVRAAREEIDEARRRLVAGEELPDDLPGRVVLRAAALGARRLVRVVNATGVVLHTNLGRAPLAPEAAAAVASVAAGYCNVEMDLASGERGSRLQGVAGLAAELAGAEAAVAVNNNAAAVLLALTALARGREVVVSRGELVEIGGAFRVPDVIASGGARLVEVGTTNRTRTDDYARAIGPDTAVLLRVHRSNFTVVGFTERPARAELAALAHERGVPLVDDLGSGALGPPLDAAGVALSDDVAEPVQRAVSEGADLVCFSGDKLLGGPQAGLAVGRRDLVERLRKHPLYRALRLDKLVLAALEATLLVYRDGRASDVPARALLARTPEQCRAAAERIAAEVPGAEVEDDVAPSGGGALPDVTLPGAVVAVRGSDPEELAARLRAGAPPVIARVSRDALIVDPRTLLPGEDRTVAAALVAALRGPAE